MPTSLDIGPRRVISEEERSMDPRVVEIARSQGIWPLTQFRAGSRESVHAQRALQQIFKYVADQDKLLANENLRRDLANQRLGETRTEHEAIQADREARTMDATERTKILDRANRLKELETLEPLASNPMVDKETRTKAQSRITQLLAQTGEGGATAAATTTATGPKGEYGPTDLTRQGGQPAGAGGGQQVTAPPPTQYTPPTGAFGGIPERPGATPRSFHASRYPASTFTPADRTRIAGNLDVQDAEDARINELLYKSGIGGENYASVYGTSDPNLIRPGMPPAADIPQMYRGEPTIPEGAGVGYYGRKGEFLGPAYTESGQKIKRPKGATGMVGTAGRGLTYDEAGNITTRLSPEVAQAISGKTTTPTMGGVANVPPKETMIPTEVGTYTPPTAAFTTGGEKGSGAPAVPQTPQELYAANVQARIARDQQLAAEQERIRLLLEEEARRRTRTTGRPVPFSGYRQGEPF